MGGFGSGKGREAGEGAVPVVYDATAVRMLGVSSLRDERIPAGTPSVLGREGRLKVGDQEEIKQHLDAFAGPGGGQVGKPLVLRT